ncbi:MAG: Nramp family divalent metal transporter [Deltaproteobacteria bacterium]|jgi:manganese transport protein|nr:Nramp family divalent metal transporter [Deltaproteobacteria bacterium]
MPTDDRLTNFEKSGFRRFFRQMGPAWIVSAVACGPATMASVSIAGSQYGYQLLWVVVLSALLAFVVQFMAAKIGMIGGKGIISLVEESWGNLWAWILMIDALLATWLAAAVLMKALVGTTVLVTGVSTPWWSLLYTVLIFFLVGMGGYRWVESICKALVAFVVGCFIVTVMIIKPDLSGMAKGLIPTFIGGSQGALMMAGIMGGAVHITIIAMHTYNVNARKWRTNDMNLAFTDTFLSMFIAFGVYSVTIFVAAAAVLHPQGIEVRTAFDLARPLKPVLGVYAHGVFLGGFWAAVFSTITPTYLAAGYFIADKMKWEVSVRDTRFKAVVFLGCLISLIGPLVKGSFLILLVVMLALGLCGTPLVVFILLFLLNQKTWAKEHRNGWWLNLLGGATLLITTFLAVRFILTKTGIWAG